MQNRLTSLVTWWIIEKAGRWNRQLSLGFGNQIAKVKDGIWYIGWCRVYLVYIYILYCRIVHASYRFGYIFNITNSTWLQLQNAPFFLTTFPSMEKPARWGNPRATVTFEWHGGTHYRLVQKSGLECSNEKTVFWQQFAWTVSIFRTFSTKTRTLVKEMTCVLYSWKICWSGGCLIENLFELADFFNGKDATEVTLEARSPS